MYGPNPQFPPFVPIPTSPKRGHRFDRAMAANRQRAQSSGSRGIGQTTSLTSNSETNAAALCLISEKKALLAEAEAQESAAREMYYYAQNESWWLGSPDSYQVSDSDDTTYSEHEYRERQEAEEREKAARRELEIAEARSRDRFATVQAVAAVSGHPNAAQDGNWSILSACEQEAVLPRLENECHDYATLTNAGYLAGRVRAPRPDPRDRKRRVVAIDCEFVGITNDDISVLAQVCAVDALTGEVLLDFLVEPGHRKVIYRTQHSGLTGQVFHQYREMGLVVPDVAAAREALFSFVDRDTILVGFALENDFEMLGISHWRVFDAQLAAREAEYRAYGVRPRRLSLRILSSQLLGRSVQQSSRGHDCLEDVFAARELMLYWVQDENEDEVEEWVQWQGGDRSNGVSTFDIQFRTGFK